MQAFILLLTTSAGVSAATLVWNTGSFAGPESLLIGATDVFVENEAYDVSFVDGSCHDVFGFEQCAFPGDFTFSSLPAAQAATAALIDQVFNQSLGGDHFLVDYYAQMTNGCEETSANCFIATPFTRDGTSVDSSIMLNTRLTASDNGSGGFHYLLDDLSNITSFTFADWNEVSPVPLLPTPVLFLSALLGIVIFRRPATAGPRS